MMNSTLMVSSTLFSTTLLSYENNGNVTKEATVDVETSMGYPLFVHMLSRIKNLVIIIISLLIILTDDLRNLF